MKVNTVHSTQNKILFKINLKNFYVPHQEPHQIIQKPAASLVGQEKPEVKCAKYKSSSSQIGNRLTKKRVRLRYFEKCGTVRAMYQYLRLQRSNNQSRLFKMIAI